MLKTAVLAALPLAAPASRPAAPASVAPSAPAVPAAASLSLAAASFPPPLAPAGKPESVDQLKRRLSERFDSMQGGKIGDSWMPAQEGAETVVDGAAYRYRVWMSMREESGAVRLRRMIDFKDDAWSGEKMLADGYTAKAGGDAEAGKKLMESQARVDFAAVGDPKALDRDDRMAMANWIDWKLRVTMDRIAALVDAKASLRVAAEELNRLAGVDLLGDPVATIASASSMPARSTHGPYTNVYVEGVLKLVLPADRGARIAVLAALERFVEAHGRASLP